MAATPSRAFKPKFNKRTFLSYSPEGNFFVMANQQSTPKFCSHGRFLGGVRCLKTGEKLKKDIQADRQMMKSLYKSNNPYVPSNFKPKTNISK
mmetsp:Transcript_23126/g.20324  ORF Transcript_23126/g.20324 Transcript_23126/m.20324 type:complete len:93 (-) Transcript_23126:223-501(-)